MPRRSLLIQFGGVWSLWLLAAAVVFCVFSVSRYIWIWYGPGSWGPRFACSDSCFDFRTVARNQSVRHQFVIGNTGRQLLQITDVVPGCGGCVSLKLPRTALGSGETCPLDVLLDTKQLKAGPFVRPILVKTNDPNSRAVLLYIQGIAE